MKTQFTQKYENTAYAEMRKHSLRRNENTVYAEMKTQFTQKYENTAYAEI